MTMISSGKKMVPPPTTVTSAMVKKADWQPMLTAVGSISPVQGAMISAELAGTVAEINFQSGSRSRKAMSFEAGRFRGEAQLRSAQADAELAKSGLRPRARSREPQSDFGRRVRRRPIEIHPEESGGREHAVGNR